MNREEFLQQKESGVAVETAEQDDAVQEETQEEVQETSEEEVHSEEETEDIEESNESTDEETDDLPELPEEQKTAFQKRLEREQRKIREQAEQELKEQYESQYSKHKQVVDLLGGDPDAVERMIRENQMKAQAQSQAQQMAQYYGWDEEQTQQYVQQQVKEQQREQELAELKVQVQINDLKDNPDYAGIGSMKQEIQSMISRSNGTLNVEQAYWALGGKSRAEQLRREEQQRQIAKRSKPKRTVQSDSPTSGVAEKALPPEIEAERVRMGLSVKEARALLEDTPKNLEEFRKQRS